MKFSDPHIGHIISKLVSGEFSINVNYDRRLLSPIVRFLSQIYFIRDFCEESFSDFDKVRCSGVVFFSKEHSTYDNLKEQGAG